MCVGRTMQEQLSRRSNRRIASYVTVATTKKTDEKASQLFKLFHAHSLVMSYLFGEVQSLHGFVKKSGRKAGRITLDKDSGHCLQGYR
jgi:hypothetical protein